MGVSPVLYEEAPLSDFQTDTGGVGQTEKLPRGAVVTGDVVIYPVPNPAYEPPPMTMNREERRYLPRDGGPGRSPRAVQVFSPSRFVTVTDGTFVDLEDTVAISCGGSLLDVEFNTSPGVIFPLVGIIGTAYLASLTARSDGVLAIM